MRATLFAILLSFVMAGAAAAADTPKVNLDVKGVTLQEAFDKIAADTGTTIIVDPKARGTVTVKWSGVELVQALDFITKHNSLAWKKVQFAKSQDSKVTSDQLRLGILALASMPVTGLAIEDPATKMSTVFAKDVPSAMDTSKVELPPGYSWTTAYVILVPEKAGTPKPVGGSLAQLATMAPDQRVMMYQNQWAGALNFTRDERRQVLLDQFKGIAATAPDVQSARQLINDVEHAMDYVKDNILHY